MKESKKWLRRVKAIQAGCAKFVCLHRQHDWGAGCCARMKRALEVIGWLEVSAMRRRPAGLLHQLLQYQQQELRDHKHT
ncbi:hypothetical protein ACE6H2_026167 [Prunus campanulata]